MPRQVFTGAGLVIALNCWSGATQPQQALAGHWEGAIQAPGQDGQLTGRWTQGRGDWPLVVKKQK
jgi:hypothetical protein